MPSNAETQVEHTLNQLLRHPEPVPDPLVQRALTRLLAARTDAPYLLLHRTLVLEAALARLQAAATAAASASAPSAASAAPAAPAAPAARHGFLRDAAVITAGVLGGGLLLHAVHDLGDAGLPDLGTDLTDLF